jgi:acyl-homoserine lactone acylase PvdQ
MNAIPRSANMLGIFAISNSPFVLHHQTRDEGNTPTCPFKYVMSEVILEITSATHPKRYKYNGGWLGAEKVQESPS